MPGRYKEGTVHWEESRQRWRAFVSVDGRRYSKWSRRELLRILQQLISKPFRARLRDGLHFYYFPTYCEYSQRK